LILHEKQFITVTHSRCSIFSAQALATLQVARDTLKVRNKATHWISSHATFFYVKIFPKNAACML